jgi:hypothetical protein
VVALLTGGLETNSLLVGAGALSTAVTVTFFYMLVMEIFRVYTKGPRTVLYWLVMACGIIRLLFMILPGNQWGGVADLTYFYARNAFLTVMGLIIAVLYLRTGIQQNDKTLKLIALFIFISYCFYLPVILFVRIAPMLGLLMIPKTCAYVAIAIIGNKRLFKKAD